MKVLFALGSSFAHFRPTCVENCRGKEVSFRFRGSSLTDTVEKFKKWGEISRKMSYFAL